MKTICVVGAGALGSHFVQFARSIPETRFRVIDDDRVEAKNTLAQMHGKPGIGKLKTESLRSTMQFLWGLTVDGRHVRLRRDNAATLLDGADLVVDCLDNPESRRLLQEVAAGRPILHGALAASGLDFGQVVWSPRFVPEGGAGGATCLAGENLPFIGMVASTLAFAAQRFIEKDERLNFQVRRSGSLIF